MTKPNIYFASSITGASSKDHENATDISARLQQHGKIMTELIGNPNIHEIEAENMAKGVNIAHRDLALLADSDVMVAGITNGSIDVGKEISYALDTRRIPVLAIHQKGKKASQRVDNFKHPLLTNVSYKSLEDLENQIDNFFEGQKLLGELRTNLILCDGIDGSGKGVVSKAIGDFFRRGQTEVLDVTKFSQQEGYIPSWEDIKDDFLEGGALLVAEPTYCGMGKIIRDELIRNGSTHDVLSVAQAYSLDRAILFDNLVGPAIESGITVVMDRGVFATQVYQPVQGEMFEGYDSEHILGMVRGLPGNQREMEYVPGLIILPDVDPKIAMERLGVRSKKDDALFEEPNFQSRIAEVYASKRIEDWYTRRGSKIVHLPQNEGEGPSVTKARTIEAYENYLDSIEG